jgi:hypothetical protein
MNFKVITTTFLEKKRDELKQHVLILTVKKTQPIPYIFIERMRRFVKEVPHKVTLRPTPSCQRFKMK